MIASVICRGQFVVFFPKKCLKGQDDTLSYGKKKKEKGTNKLFFLLDLIIDRVLTKVCVCV